jgi:hypothetical protein
LNYEWNHNNSIWNKNYEELKRYKATHNTTRVPQSYPTLGKWVKKHRNEWSRLKTQNKVKSSNAGREKAEAGNFFLADGADQCTFLTQDCIKKLNNIGFEWVARNDTWDYRYQQLLEYKKEFENVNVNVNVNVPQGKS